MNPKIRPRVTRLVVLASVATTLGLIAPLHASLLVYDGFDYTGVTNGSKLHDSNQPSAGIGFGGAGSQWKITSGKQGDSWTYSTSDLSFSSNHISSGGSVVLNTPSGQTVGADIYRTLSADVSGTTYGSFIFSINSRGGGSQYSPYLGSTTASTVLFGATINNSTPTPFAKLSGSGNQQNGSGPVVLGTAYMYLWKSDLEATTQTVTFWVLTSSQYDYFFSNGFTLGALSAASTGTGPGSVSSTATVSGTAALGALSAFHLSGNNAPQVGGFDELRIGTTLADAVGAVAIPEPSSIVCLSGILSLVTAFGIRRRGRNVA